MQARGPWYSRRPLLPGKNRSRVPPPAGPGAPAAGQLAQPGTPVIRLQADRSARASPQIFCSPDEPAGSHPGSGHRRAVSWPRRRCTARSGRNRAARSARDSERSRRRHRCPRTKLRHSPAHPPASRSCCCRRSGAALALGSHDTPSLSSAKAQLGGDAGVALHRTPWIGFAARPSGGLPRATWS